MMDRRDSLKDLPGVAVVVEEFDSVAERAGFDSRTFQTDVELKLRLAKIKVLAIEDGDDSLAWLYLNVNTLHRETGQKHAYNVSLELLQDAYLRPQPRSDPESASGDAVWAPTWSGGVVGFGTVAHVRDTVKDLVDRFANDWLAANPLIGTP